MHRLKRLDASLIHMLMDSVRGVVVALPLNAAIGAIGAFAAGVLTLGLAMDTPWAPWDPASERLFPPGLFTALVVLGGLRNVHMRLCIAWVPDIMEGGCRSPVAGVRPHVPCHLWGVLIGGRHPRSRTDVDVVASHHRHSSALVDSPLGRRPWGHATCKTWALMSRPSPHFR